MADESAKRAAQEYLAAKLSEEGQSYEDKLNLEAAIALGPKVWKKLADTVITNCQEWNAITKKQTLTCKETTLGMCGYGVRAESITRCLCITIRRRDW